MTTFTLKFTPENLQRHLARDPNDMWTVRDESKGKIGDVTIIDGSIWVLVTEIGFCTKWDHGAYVAFHYHKCTGFNSMNAFLSELRACYESVPDPLYVLHLIRTSIPAQGLVNLAREGNYGLPEALALAAMLKVNCGGPIPLDEANLQCNRYGITILDVESRYPDIIHRIQETITTEEDGVYQEIANTIEFGEYNDKGEALYQQIRRSP
ncbi:MAG: hypothetical protein O0V67_01600 [Methanocorpusculum sp.]|nr:hypothetical protein [Methanocorpusculum sp.]